MDNVVVEIKNNTVYCYKKNNTYTNRIISIYTGLILDICNIISQYFNHIMFNIDISPRSNYIMNVHAEYIDFKQFTHNYSIHKNGNKWTLWIENNTSTILNNIMYDQNHTLQIFNAYIKKY